MRHDDEILNLLAAAVAEAASPRSATAFELRYGLTDGIQRTLEATGSETGVTRERVRQIVHRVPPSIRRRALQGHAGPCSQLINELEQHVQPNAVGLAARCGQLVSIELPHLKARTAADLVFAILGISQLQRRMYAVAVETYIEHERELAEEADAKACRQEAFAVLLENAFWPDPTRRQSVPLPSVVPKRSGNENSVAFWSHKLDRPVVCDSELERHVFLQLDDHPLVASFLEQPLALDYEHRARIRTYFPDALVKLVDGRTVLVEIKPATQMGLAENVAKWRAALQFCRERGYGFLVTDNRRTLSQVLDRHIPPGFEQRLGDALRNGHLDWPTCKRIRDEEGAHALDLTTFVLRNRLVWTLSPMRIEAAGVAS